MHEMIEFECDFCGFEGVAVAHDPLQVLCPLCENATHVEERVPTAWPESV